MHFSKTYTELLLSLPPELRNNAIQYRQLKKLINQVVNELASLGLQPSVLQELLDHGNNVEAAAHSGRESVGSDSSHESLTKPSSLPKVVYEFTPTPNSTEPRLRLRVKLQRERSVELSSHRQSERLDAGSSDVSRLDDVAGYTQITSPNVLSGNAATEGTKEFVIPLLSDTAFFQLLSTALQSLSTHLLNVQSEFITTLEALSRDISLSARPVSSSSTVHPHSPSSRDASVSFSSSIFAAGAKSDLYTWRELFQLYVEAEVFESVGEAHRGERTVEDSEAQLQAFVGRVTQRGLAKKLKLTQSRTALQTFLELNIFILNIKKFQFASNEATRKILKKHAKRTALPLPETEDNNPAELALIHLPSTSLPRVLVQAIGETLLPIIPHLDDYTCLICTSIAFKPIRLRCGHLFCVRCLVKMQKRNKGNCPMCRAPTVLAADRSNVDWALLNFMQDWFPVETKAKLKANEREAADEDLQDLGIDPNGCVIA